MSLYAEAWPTCSRCGVTQPMTSLENGICRDVKWCEKAKIQLERAQVAWDKAHPIPALERTALAEAPSEVRPSAPTKPVEAITTDKAKAKELQPK